MTFSSKKEKGTVTVTIGGKEQEKEFLYDVVDEGDDDSPVVPSFDEVVGMLTEKFGYAVELPTIEERKAIEEQRKANKERGRAAEPKSLTRALITFFNNKNAQEARSRTISEAENTVDAGLGKIIAQYDALLKRTDLTPEQRAKIEAKKKETLELIS